MSTLSVDRISTLLRRSRLYNAWKRFRPHVIFTAIALPCLTICVGLLPPNSPLKPIFISTCKNYPGIKYETTGNPHEEHLSSSKAIASANLLNTHNGKEEPDMLSLTKLPACLSSNCIVEEYDEETLNAFCDQAIFFPRQDPADPRLKYLMARPVGRMGTDRFIMASVLGLAHAQNRAVCFSSRESHVELRGLRSLERKASQIWLHVSERSWRSFDSCLLKLPQRNIVVGEYLQSYKYFQQSWDAIKDYVRFPDSILKEAATLLDTVWDQTRHPRNVTSIVGVHVTRKDMLSGGPEEFGHTTATESYLLKAIKWMTDAITDKKTLFVVVTDDIAWCEYHLSGYYVRMAPEASPEVHLALLASCDHVIMSTGTFGWWGAWLAGGKVVYYKTWAAENSELAKSFNKNDFFLPTWVGLE